MIVYFDTNVFDHLEQLNGVNEWGLFRIRRAVRHGCIRVVIGYLNIEETLFIVSSQPKRAEARERWPHVFGQNVPFLKWSLAVVCLRSAEPCGQVVNIHSIRCVPVKRPVRPGLVIERQVAC